MHADEIITLSLTFKTEFGIDLFLMSSTYSNKQSGP